MPKRKTQRISSECKELIISIINRWPTWTKDVQEQCVEAGFPRPTPQQIMRIERELNRK